MKTHGHATKLTPRHPVYGVWREMRKRCRNRRHKSFAVYGGRGITVCERWHKFENFLADMGERPSPKHSIDRIDNDGNYEPGNCRWATTAEQGRNRTATKLTPDAVRKIRKSHSDGASIVLLAEKHGVSYGVVFNVVRRITWKDVA